MNEISTTFASSHFTDALALYRHARREMETQPLAETVEDEREESLLCDAFAAAEKHLLETAAPDLSAILAKLEIFARDGEGIPSSALPYIVDDLMRVGGLTVSPAFDPLLWLCHFERAGGKIMADQFLCMAADNERAANMVKRLRSHERSAIAAYQRANPMEA